MLIADTSVVMEWFLPETSSASSQRAFELAQRAPIVVPALWLWETHNVVLTYLRRKMLTADRVAEIRLQLALVPRRVDGPPDERTIDRTWQIAARQMATSYDASYVELASRLGLPLASSDRGVRHAAAGMGVDLI